MKSQKRKPGTSAFILRRRADIGAVRGAHPIKVSAAGADAIAPTRRRTRGVSGIGEGCVGLLPFNHVIGCATGRAPTQADAGAASRGFR